MPKHTSVLKLSSPIEFIESSKISPFISKVQIKVCYVGEEPSRNHSVITKEVAKEMGPSLRGCPIVGFYNKNTKDFEEHNQQINISNGQWEITDSTTPYGFVDLNAKIWFATYIDDEKVERTYLCTEGYIWDHAYPEAERIKTKGNNHSMELDEDTLDAEWAEDENGFPEFFIINEAFFSKLCVLGEDYEPCFEGSQITSFSLKIDDSFQKKMYSMMNEIKELLTGGGTKVFTTYSVKIGDALWSALYSYIEKVYSNEEKPGYSKYAIDGVFTEGDQKFAVLKDSDEKYYRLNFSFSEEDGFQVETNLVSLTDYSEKSQFEASEVEAYIVEFVKKKEEEKEKNEGKTDKENNKDSEEQSEEKEKEDSKKEDSDEDEEDKKKKKKFSYDSLDEIPEYVELRTKFSNLETQVTTLNNTITSLNKEIAPLREFKVQAERKEKEDMISRFYMLSEEDKKEVTEKIDTYSLDDIEAKLSILCVRNKVSFSDNSEKKPETTFNLHDDKNDDSTTPAWVKAALETAKTLN